MEIQIQKESQWCLRCKGKFTHDQKHHSLLRIEDNNFLREDYCEKCWPERSVPADGDKVYSHWETKYRDPSVARATPEGQFMPLLKLCYESIAEGGRDAEAVAYVCALVLRRQKVFRFVREEKEQPSGKGFLIFADKYNDTQIRVVDPRLTEMEMQGVRRKLEEHMGSVRGQADVG